VSFTPRPKGRRSNIQVIVDIMTASIQERKKTRLVYAANLNFRIITKYLDYLIKQGLLQYDAEEQVYRTTQRGRDFLDANKKINEFLVTAQPELFEAWQVPRRQKLSQPLPLVATNP